MESVYLGMAQGSTGEAGSGKMTGAVSNSSFTDHSCFSLIFKLSERSTGSDVFFPVCFSCCLYLGGKILETINAMCQFDYSGCSVSPSSFLCDRHLVMGGK